MAREARTLMRAVSRLRQRLLADQSARLVVLVAISLAAAIGFLVSAIALASGVEQMAVRYLFAALTAYAAFLLLLNEWVKYRRRQLEPDVDLPDLDLADLAAGDPDMSVFAGGKSGGSGGGAAWDPMSMKTQAAEAVGAQRNERGLSLDLDDLWWVVVVFALLLGGVVGVLYVLYLAPALVAEAILDGIVATAVYRRLRRRDVTRWSVGMLPCRTWKPAALVIASISLAGLVTQQIFPDADSIGDVIRRFQ